MSHFNFDKVVNMVKIFAKCYSLKDININNFNLNGFVLTRYMFSRCPSELKNKIKNTKFNLDDNAFDDDWD